MKGCELMSWFLLLGLGFIVGIATTLIIGFIVNYIIKTIKDYIDEKEEGDEDGNSI